MSDQPTLLSAPRPRLPGAVDYGCGRNVEAIGIAQSLGGATLVIADPAWAAYSQRPGVAAPDGKYPVESYDIIAATLHLAGTDGARKDSRLALWHTFPLLVEEMRDVAAGKRKPLVTAPWVIVSGGAWLKMQEPGAGDTEYHGEEHVGVGFHWLGAAEPVLLFKQGSPPSDRSETLRNGCTSMPGEHSAKPEAWQAQWIRRWTSPGDLVLDLWPGLGGVARACIATGRRYVGRELDPERHARGLGLIGCGRTAA